MVIAEDGPVAAHPVERDEAVRADRLSFAPAGQVLVQVLPALRGVLAVAFRDAEARPPREDVADRALARLVAELARDDPAVHHAADAGYVRDPVAVHDVAGRGAHDREHLTRRDRP